MQHRYPTTNKRSRGDPPADNIRTIPGDVAVGASRGCRRRIAACNPPANLRAARHYRPPRCFQALDTHNARICVYSRNVFRRCTAAFHNATFRARKKRWTCPLIMSIRCIREWHANTKKRLPSYVPVMCILRMPRPRIQREDVAQSSVRVRLHARMYVRTYIGARMWRRACTCVSTGEVHRRMHRSVAERRERARRMERPVST